MGCVNIKSHAFKTLAEHNDLDVNTLELITHKYWLETGNENSFPSDVYIQAQKGVGKYLEPIAEVREAWQKNYSEPLEFKTIEELNIAKQEALKLFPADAVSYTKNFSGNFVLRVKQPVESYNPSIQDYSSKENYSEQEQLDFNLLTSDNNIFANRDFFQYYNYLFRSLQSQVTSGQRRLKEINKIDGTNFGYRNGKFYMNAHPTLHGVKIEGINKKVSIKKLIARDEMMHYLIDKFNLKYGELSDADFNKKFGTAIINNAIVTGDTIYVRKDRVLNLTNEQILEEFLHPTIHAIASQTENPLFKQLLDEARANFSLLDSQIKALYKEQSQQVQDEELVAQVLAKYVNKEISDNGTNTRKLVNYIQQFFEWVANQFKDLFGNVSIDDNSRVLVSGTDIKEVLDLENLAQLINIRNIKFKDTLHDNSAFYNRTEAEVPSSYEGTITPDENTIFVFGSNPEGRHGAGAAKVAREKFGAIYGQGEGLQGKAYALPTKDLRVKENNGFRSIPPEQITENIRKMYEVAQQNPDKQFKVAYTNGLDKITLNGYTGAEMIKMFKDAGPIPSNVIFSKNWTDHWSEIESTPQTTQETVLTQEEASETSKAEVQENLSQFERFTKQINNLLDSNIISASEIRHTAELIVNSISDTITIVQTQEGALEKFFPTVATSLDLQTASRKEIIEAIGIDRLIERAKLQFDPEQNNYDYDVMEQAELIVDNWDGIVYLASDIFAMNEGLGIIKSFDKNGFATTDAYRVGYDNFNSENSDPDAMREAVKDEQEHWQIESRTIDVLNSMSTLVRLAINQCYQLDKEGNKVFSKWGIAERVNPRKAVNSILRWTKGSLSLEDMIKQLSEKAARNPWVKQLIKRLSDTTGNEADFQSQFYGVFAKHFQPYSIVKLDDGKYHSIPVNDHPALSEAMRSVTAQFQTGEHPLFTAKGINEKLLGTTTTVAAEHPFNLHKALTSLQTLLEGIKRGEQLTQESSSFAAANLTGVAKILGYPVTEEMVAEIVNEESITTMTEALRHIVHSLDEALKEQKRTAGTIEAKQYNPFAFGTDNNINGAVKNFLTPITDSLEDTAINAFYDSGKMYQSYVTPSFMTKLMNKFRQEGKAFEDFIMQEYGNSEWFKSSKRKGFGNGWNNVWLKMLATNEQARKAFDHKVELNFNKHNYMRNMSDAEYALSLITEYFSEPIQKGQSMVPAWFRIPMLSNKPSSEFIKFLSYRGASYKDEIVNGLHMMFNQELSRIQTVRMRNLSKGDAEFISNFDTNGRKFNFLPFLNGYLSPETASKTKLLRDANGAVSKDNVALAGLLQKKLEGTTALTSEEEARLSNLVDRAIYTYMDNRAQSILTNWRNSGILEAAKAITNVGEDNSTIEANLENFIWNDNFAAKNILQLTVTDIAFYKDAEELQKRLAQLHAPGIRGNVAATDYGDPAHGISAQRVSDGNYRTIIIKDLDKFKTDLIANISEVFDRKIEAAPDNQKPQLRALKEVLVGKDGKYTKINVTDGQGYSSPSSYRKKALIFGKWSRHAEEIYQKLKNGKYTFTDLKTAFQPMKPFVYSHLHKNMGVSNAPIQTMNVPFQAKNSEYLLIMADALLQGESLSHPNLLRAIYQVMEDSEKNNPTKGIDTVQFGSAIKSGLQAEIDINQFREVPNGEKAAYDYITSLIYKQDSTGKSSSNYNTDVFVHEAPYEDFCLQQEIPEHFKEHFQIHGSQIRMIIPSDLDLYKNPNGDLTAEDNQVYYEWTEPDGTHKKMKANEFRKEYERTIAENIEESIVNLEAELHFNSRDRKERNIALSKILQREILSSPRYGVDLIQACSIDKETGDFRIPKGDPIQAKRIEQLINSIIKDRVNKQKIAGGPIVQVSNYGTSKQLHIRFNDKKGGLLMTREEYEQNPVKREISQTEKFNARYKGKAASGTLSYENYVKENQAGIAYFEVYMPIWSNELFEKFADENGNIDIAAIEALNPELLKMVSYRIPTEDKYSMAPMKVVGFMPKEAGDAMMFPYELTEIDDSDFDIDKRYVMRKDIDIKTKDYKEIKQQLFDRASESYKKAHNGKANNKYIGEQVEMFMRNPEKMRHADAFMESLYKEYQRIAYYTDAPTVGKRYRDNKVIDMTWAVLTNEVTADKILNPGGFDPLKRAGYMVAAYKNPANNYTWTDLEKMSIDELSEACYTDKDLTWADTQIQFYKQNSAAASLIGVFAVNKVAHATLESNDIMLDVREICGANPFIIAGMEFGGRMYLDPKYDLEGNLIGKSLGMGVSASADAAKTPVLNLMNINMSTIGVYATLLRLGMPVEDASLFMSQNVIEKVLNEFNKENLTNYVSLTSVIDRYLQEFRDRNSIADNSVINTEPLTRDELIDGITPNEGDLDVIDYKVLLAFQKLRSLTDQVRKPTFVTRFNSIASAVGPLIVDNLMMEHRMEQFSDTNASEGTHFYSSDGSNVDIDDILFDHPILKQFSKTVDIAKSMFLDMPAGSVGFRNLLDRLPNGLADRIFNDKQLLDDLSMFYQSYLLIASKMIDPHYTKNYIDGFPKYFSDQKYKEKYADNILIQSIRTNVNKKTGKAFLTINITGLDQTEKEVFYSAWTDLHKQDPELSTRLFEYCFFRGGIGFTPKTFMSLVPTYVKERLVNPKSGASYISTYRNLPTVNPSTVIDQWIRNNWSNNKLVPKRSLEKTKYLIDWEKGILQVYDEKDLSDLRGVVYMKISQGKQTSLWRLVGQEGQDNAEKLYMRIKPLGNNNEYLEMSLDNIKDPLINTTQTVEDMKESEIQSTSHQQTDSEGPSEASTITDTEKAKNVAQFADALMRQNPKLNRTEAFNKIEEMKSREDISIFGDFLSNVFKQMGVTLNKEEAIKEFKKFC